MRTFRSYSPLIAVYVLMLGILFGASTAGCNKDTRATGLHAAVLTTDAAREGFLAYDTLRVAQIINDSPTREIAEQRLAAYHQKADKVVLAIHLTYRALALAATQTDEVSLKAAMSQIGELIAAITDIQKDATPIGAAKTPTPEATP